MKISISEGDLEFFNLLALRVFGHTNRNVSVSYESQREIALILALSRPIPDYQQGESGKNKRGFVSQGLCFLIRIRIRYNATKMGRFPNSEGDLQNPLLQCLEGPLLRFGGEVLSSGKRVSQSLPKSGFRKGGLAKGVSLFFLS